MTDDQLWCWTCGALVRGSEPAEPGFTYPVKDCAHSVTMSSPWLDPREES